MNRGTAYYLPANEVWLPPSPATIIVLAHQNTRLSQIVLVSLFSFISADGRTTNDKK
jgi:hypothetical protein